MIILGVDPDSKAHGTAMFIDGVLTQLNMWALVDIIKFIDKCQAEGLTLKFSIEDVKAKKCVYSQHSSAKARPQGEIGRRLGLCQQSQIELERVLDGFGVPYSLHKPQKGNWADTKLKSQFEKVTRWNGRSNADTRSAAFMGYLSLRR